jgi:uncharacterized cysteine cluster protein YcgN (CxxCxxCC family)
LSCEPAPFWKTKSLGDMTPEEWESLCDGCGRCCLIKLEDEDTGHCYLTRLSCGLLDIGSCRCSDYENRARRMPDCVSISADVVPTLHWLPETCGYRLVGEGRDLFWWHPLVSGSPETVHEAGISVRTLARSETGVRPSAIHKYIIGPAGRAKGGARPPKKSPPLQPVVKSNRRTASK